MPAYFTLTLFLLVSAFLHGQATDSRGMYFVGFGDKEDSAFSIDRPREFLGERALARRAKHGSPVTALDLPISAVYEDRVAATGAPVWLRSKWMNGLVVVATPDQLAVIEGLPFVDTAYYVAPHQYEREASRPSVPDLDRPAPEVTAVPVTRAFYGYGFTNLEAMHGDSLHRLGYRGRGVLVAVFDGGFPDVGYKDFLGYDQAAAVPAGYDLVEQDSTALDGGAHGSTVLSTMAAHHPFFYIGMAPEARYVLFKTENGRGEHRLEEINYAVALELADSVGVDVVNSSLGYTTFSDSTMNYSYADLDGNRSPASRAVDHAFARGMIVVTSAGNSGSSPWRHLGIPADARGAFSIGAVDDYGTLAAFSSVGPTADGRTKPDVSAPGVMVPAVASNGKGLTGATGTSLSSPQVAALVACLVQAFPRATNQQLLSAIRNTASQAEDPNPEIGYGIPNFAAAYRELESQLR